VEKRENDSYLYELIRLGIVGLLIVLSWMKIWHPYVEFDVTAIFAVIVGGYPLFKDAYNCLKGGKLGAEGFMSLGVIAAFAIGEFLSAAVIAFFMLIADFLEDFTVDKSRRAISDLIEATPKTARVRRSGKEVEVPVEQIRTTDLVIVKPGERIPVDGKIASGRSSVNQAPITGESIPVEKNPGDAVFAGTINELGVLYIKTLKVGKDTTIGRIIELVEEAQQSKAPVQRVADRFTTYFTPIILGVTIIAYFITRNPIAAITVIIVGCPCAVALATPLAVVAGIGKASKHGILVKGGIYLETLGKVDTVVIDKTGTLTLGEPQVTDVKAFGEHDEKEIITLAAVTEKHSEHPLAHAIMRKAQEYGVEVPDPREFYVVRGKGVIAKYGKQRVIIGNKELLRDQRVGISKHVEDYLSKKEEEGKTAILLAHDAKVCGMIGVADVLRGKAVPAIRELGDRGVRLVMLTGDNPRTAKAIAKQVGIDEVLAEMMPEEKVDKVKEITRRGNIVAMVGDGINDAPALAQASVGIAMGVMGVDAAIEAADVALMTDDLTKVSAAIDIGKKTFRTIRQNLVIGILFNVIGISLAASGFLSPIAAAIAHVLPDTLVFANSAKLFR